MKFQIFLKDFGKLLAERSAIPEGGVPMNATEEGAQTASEENIHEHQASFIPNEGYFQLGTRDSCAPRIFSNLILNKGTYLFPPEKTDRRTE